MRQESERRNWDYAQRDPTGRSKLDLEDRDYPCLQLAKILETCIVEMNGKPIIRAAALRLKIARHWSKISTLAHQIHDEETAS